MGILTLILLAQDNSSVFFCCWLPVIFILIILIGSIVSAFQQSRLEKELQIASEKRMEEMQRESARRAEEIRKEVQEHEKQMDQAREKYGASLEALKLDPSNADLKQFTLALGRKYSELTRKLNGGEGNVTVYDEVALLNDINAATAGASIKHDEKNNLSSIEERLAKLNELKGKELISEEEYESRRQKILDEI